MAELGSAYVNIIPKAPGMEKELKKMLGDNMPDTNKQGQKLGSGLVSGIKKGVAGAAIGKVIKDAFEAGGNLQQSFGGLETIYGDAANQAKKYAKEAAKAGISANSYAEQAVSFGASLKQAFGGDTTAAMEAANTAIMDMTDNAAKMGTPLERIQTAYQGFAKQNYTMLDNLKLGYGGTKTEMERLLADAQALTGVKYDIGNLGDVYEAIHVIQGELGLTGVAALEAQTTLTGSFAAVQASWTNVLAALTTGEGLDVAVQNLSATVGNFANVILDMLGELLPQIPTFFSGLGAAFIENAPSLTASAAEMIGQLIIGFLNGIPTFIENVPEFFAQVQASFSAIDWASIGSGIVEGIGNGISAVWESLVNSKLGQLASSAVSKIKGVLGINSPSKVFANEVGRWIPEGIALGIETNLTPVNSSIDAMAVAASAEMRRATVAGAARPVWTQPEPYSGTNTTPTVINNKTTIEFTGSLAQLARVLQPYIVEEGNRRGTQFST